VERDGATVVNDEVQKATMSDGRALDPLREAFVGMLFALAIAQIGINAAAVIAASAPAVPLQPGSKVTASAHLFVALLLIACSWVGWRQSVSPGITEKISGVFRRSFVGLLLDVILVVLYFIIVQRAEINTVTGQIAVEPTSARPEANGLLWVFAVYIGWDLLTDVLSPGCIPSGVRWFGLKTIAAAVVSILASALCFVLVVIVFLAAANAKSAPRVIALDVALAATILLFRSLKPVEKPLSKHFGVSDWPAFSKPREASTAQLAWGWICSIVYIVAIVAVVGPVRSVTLP
jgi:hypothetical protein